MLVKKLQSSWQDIDAVSRSSLSTGQQIDKISCEWKLQKNIIL